MVTCTVKSQITNHKSQGKFKFQNSNSKRFEFGVLCLFVVCNLIFGISRALPVRAETPQEIQSLIDERQKQINDIEAQIADYWKAVDEKKGQGATVQNEIDTLKTKIQKSELEIRGLQLAAEQSNYKLKQTQSKIGTVSGEIGAMRGRLVGTLIVLRQQEEIPPLIRFVEADKLSDMFMALGSLAQLNGSLQGMLEELKGKKTELETVYQSIEEEKIAQDRLRRIEESQKEIAARQKTQRAQVLSKIEKEQKKILSTIVTRKADLDKIKAQITYLAQAGVSAEEAVRFGQLAAIRTGIRTSFLIAVLEVESRLGINVGKGNWKDDMHPRDRDAFLAITGKLGLDPDTTKVSRKPAYGWGGAMGPAQFLPNTWLAYEAEVGRLTGHNPPNPWSIEDAFTAAALKLSRGGASSKTREGEVRASKAYISGSGNCTKSICNSYSNLIQNKADEIEQELQKSS